MAVFRFSLKIKVQGISSENLIPSQLLYKTNSHSFLFIAGLFTRSRVKRGFYDRFNRPVEHFRHGPQIQNSFGLGLLSLAIAMEYLIAMASIRCNFNWNLFNSSLYCQFYCIIQFGRWTHSIQNANRNKNSSGLIC